MSNEQENAPASTPEEETKAPDPSVTDTMLEETTTTEETNSETPNLEESAAADEIVYESSEDSPVVPPEAVPAEGVGDDGDAGESETADTDADPEVPIVNREAKVAPDLSQLPDDIGDDFEAAIDATVLKFKEGDIVEGTIVSVDAEGAMVDIGYKSEGLIPVRELSIRNNVDPKGEVAIGDRVEGVVLDMEDDEGRMILSKKRAMYERAWGRIQEVSDAEGTVEGTVIEVVKGGLIVDIGLRGFLPASLVDLRRVRDLDPFIGTTISAKVIELDRARNNVVLSRRAHLEEALAGERTEFFDNLQEGEVREGTISSVVNFGAFVDLGGVDGLVHVSELSWQHVNHPGELVKVGDAVTIKVLEVDRDRERISLSIRQTINDPWDVFANEHEIGDVVEGTVTKTVPFGAFVSVAEGVEGLVHVSEIAMHRVESPELELSIGQKANVKITEKDDERRRVSLSIKQALPDYQERKEKADQQKQQGKPRSKPREFEREFGADAEEHPPMPVDASLEAILKELKERGIGRR